MSLYIEDLSEVYQARNFDPLTKLLNRRKLNQLLMSLENSGEECCIGILDIDYFKKFNDTYGHAVGDQVLDLWRIISGKSKVQTHEFFGLAARKW